MDVFIAAAAPVTGSRRVAIADIAAGWSDPASRGHLLVCAPDEDALTLAWGAADQALAAAGLAPAEVQGLWWGTSTPPFPDGPNLAYLAASLGLREAIEGGLLAGSRAAGFEALLAAWDAVASGRVTVALVVASDAVLPALGSAYERTSGAAGVALVLTAAEGPARLTGRASRTRPLLDRYRGPGETAVRDLYDGRLFREEVYVPEVTAVASDLGVDGPAVWSLPDPDGRLARRLAKELGADIARSAELRALVGDAAAADALLGLTACLATTGTAVAIAHGSGRALGVTAEVTAHLPGTDLLDTLGDGAREITYTQLLRGRGQLVPDDDPIEMAVPPGGAGFVRGNDELLGLHGAKCADCGTISTPPSVHPTCIGCGGSSLTEVPLARTGTIQTYVVNTTMPAPFEAPLPLLVLDLDDGARLMVHGVGAAEEVAIGGRVRLVLRRYALERGASIYGFKAAPAEAAS